MNTLDKRNSKQSAFSIVLLQDVLFLSLKPTFIDILKNSYLFL